MVKSVTVPGKCYAISDGDRQNDPLTYLDTVFEVSDVGRGNLAISKLLALINFGPFLLSTYYWMSCSTFLGGMRWRPQEKQQSAIVTACTIKKYVQ